MDSFLVQIASILNPHLQLTSTYQSFLSSYLVSEHIWELLLLGFFKTLYLTCPTKIILLNFLWEIIHRKFCVSSTSDFTSGFAPVTEWISITTPLIFSILLPQSYEDWRTDILPWGNIQWKQHYLVHVFISIQKEASLWVLMSSRTQGPLMQYDQ